MLESVRSEISAGRAGTAIEILDRYRRDFPDGRLALEADVLRIESLFRVGRASAAIGLANKFLAKNPHSPLANRVRAMLRDAPGAAGAR
jgi:outer membrane protein assembly factor BamD (BamD/ComL family)